MCVRVCVRACVCVCVGPNVEPVSFSLMALPLLDDGVKIQVMFEV